MPLTGMFLSSSEIFFFKMRDGVLNNPQKVEPRDWGDTAQYLGTLIFSHRELVWFPAPTQ